MNYHRILCIWPQNLQNRFHDIRFVLRETHYCIQSRYFYHYKIYNPQSCLMEKESILYPLKKTILCKFRINYKIGRPNNFLLIFFGKLYFRRWNLWNSKLDWKHQKLTIKSQNLPSKDFCLKYSLLHISRNHFFCWSNNFRENVLNNLIYQLKDNMYENSIRSDSCLNIFHNFQS